MGKFMATSNLFSIQHTHGRKILGCLNRYLNSASNRNSPTGHVRFKNILSAVQSQFSVKRFKTRGLTIADYRARPVISKSRIRSVARPKTASIKTNVLNRTPKQSWPAAFKQIDASPAGRKAQKINPVSPENHNIYQQPAALTERQRIEASVQKAAAKYNLQPGLIKAVIRAESNFQVGAVSRAGARGLMQLMPATAKELGVTDSFDIDQNIDGGAKYLRKMLDRFDGNVRRALAAYNAGPATVIKYNGRVPYPETRQYVKRVLRFSRQAA